jgi:hypothetical protein
MPYRVVQWGTGNVGRFALRSLIGHSELELVGLHAHSPEKIGQRRSRAPRAVGAGTGGVQATALRVINAIRAVCEHAPGIVSTLDLPYTPTRNIALRGRR